jgi:hypothetical protein
VRQRHWKLVWDLGSNTGRYALIAADHADCVVAVDSDPRTIDKLYQSLQQEKTKRILPLVMDLADPSPGRGWRGAERRELVSRGRPQLTLCLALLHHLVLGRNLPLEEVIDWLADLGSALVIEFVDKDDPQARSLLQNRIDQHGDYRLAHFEQLLNHRFEVHRREPLASGTRTLFYAEPRTAEPNTPLPQDAVLACHH